MKALDPNHFRAGSEIRSTADRPFHFVDSGLPNLYLVGIRYLQSGRGRIVVEIPAMKQLLALIARVVVAQPEALTGAEIRFLRKRLGQKAVDFAKCISVEPETLSRIENGRQTAGDGTDKLIRLYYLLACEDPFITKARRTVIGQLGSQKQPAAAPRKLVARVKKNQWETAC